MNTTPKYLLLIEGRLYGYQDTVLARIDAKRSGSQARR